MARVTWNEFDGANGVGGSVALPLRAAKQTTARAQMFAHLRHAMHLVALWHERARQRRALAHLDERSLRDLGITRYDADVESSKPFWR